MSFLTTTSPNYLLMGSLDAARVQLAERSFAMMEDALRAARLLRGELEKLPGLRIIKASDIVGKNGVAALDETKVTINLKEWGVSGIAAGEALRKERVAVELTDPQNVLFLVTYADWAPVKWQDTVDRICKTLKKLKPSVNPLQARSVEQISLANKAEAEREKALSRKIPVTDTVMPLRRVFYGKKKTVPLTEAENYICAEPVSFYPPGIPVILPGERFTAEIIEWCSLMKSMGLPVSGPADVSLQTVRVVEE